MTGSDSVLTQATRPARRERPPAASRPGKGWSWPHYLAAIGLPILVLNVWTVIAWLADGPSQVTEFRDHGSVSWYAVRVVEGVTVLGSILVVIYLVRGCRRARRILTFEVMFCLAGATLFWADFALNFFQPVFLVSSNFVNLNTTCGHMPFVVNPDCGRAPDPLLFFFLLEAFLILACALGVSKLVGRARSHWPGISTAKLFGFVLGIGMALALVEILMLALGVWAYAGPRGISFSPGHGTQYHVFVWLETGLTFGLFSALYVFRNDKGQTLVERGLEHHTPRTRKAITMMALYASLQLVTWGPGTVPLVALSFYQDGWAKMPAHLVNDLCDAPGVEGTRYGPCPGSPGYRMPGRHSLPGRSP